MRVANGVEIERREGGRRKKMGVCRERSREREVERERVRERERERERERVKFGLVISDVPCVGELKQWDSLFR